VNVGNERDAGDRSLLARLGITHVINVTSHVPLYFEANGVKYLRIPAADSGNQNLKQYFNDAFQFIGKRNIYYYLLLFINI